MSSKKWSFVVVANRLPVRRVESEEGEVDWVKSPGGLVNAVTPVLQRLEGGAWVGWSGQADSAPTPFSLDDLHIVPLMITQEEIGDYYYGFCNRTIWPLFHDAVRQPEYHRHWWARYSTLNERFAQRAAEVAEQGAIVWVHDYHLLLAPGMLRQLRPDLRIGFFLHIPFPPQELFARLPWRQQLIEGMAGADVIGFQTSRGTQNFLRSAGRFTEAEVQGDRLVIGGRAARIGAFPVSIDFDRYESAAKEPAVKERAEQLKRQLGRGRKLIAGIDRLDYTKGIENRLKAFQELLASGRKRLEDCVFVQVAVPSREMVEEYQDLRKAVEELVGQINGQFGEVGIAAVHYLHRSLPFRELVAMYLATDVLVVTPLADGMNLVAKEYIASRYDDNGALIMSEFAGAALELKSALLVNPHDVDGLAASIDVALTMDEEEGARRMRAMRAVVKENTVFAWADSFMEALGG